MNRGNSETDTSKLFQIKICGITNVDDARWAVDCGADAIGLNFYRPSPRFVQFDRAGDIVAAVGQEVVVVGLFVNEPLEKVTSCHDSLGLDLIQLHGDEPAETLGELGDRRVIKAFRCGEQGMAGVLAYLEQCDQLQCAPQGVLIDAHLPGLYGGTGKTADWEVISRDWEPRESQKLILAGGLTAENLAEAIAAVRPDGVDVSSGVELNPGRKDQALVRQFVAAARRAFEQVSERN